MRQVYLNKIRRQLCMIEDGNVYFSNAYINAVINKLVQNDKLVKWEDKNLLLYYKFPSKRKE